MTSSEPEVLALIPARGGSKALPRKNLLKIGGIPLIGRSIRAAQNSELVTRVAVSTEDDEIASVAAEYGAEVINRPMELAGDEASSESVLLHSLSHLEELDGYRPQILCFLQCTSPLTAPEDIDGVIHALLSADADSALSVTTFHYFVWRQDPDGGVVGVNHDKSVRLRRQDREKEFLETGAVYAMDANGFRVARHRFFGHTVIHQMPVSRVLEIDDPDDVLIAEERLKAKNDSPTAALPARVDGIAFDFDGVFTDDRLLLDEHGVETVRCSRSDGMGIELLRKAGVPMIVVSKESNPVVGRRCEKLLLECHQGLENKIGVLKDWIDDRGLVAERVIYVGNDVNDLECMAAVGCSVVPADAHPAALAMASLILCSRGGDGAIRELADLVVGTQNAR